MIWLKNLRKVRSALEPGAIAARRPTDEMYGPQVQDSIPNLSPIFQPNGQTLEGSFSAVSKQNFATKYSFCSVFRDLQDFQSFAPIEIEKNSEKYRRTFSDVCQNFAKIRSHGRVTVETRIVESALRSELDPLESTAVHLFARAAVLRSEMCPIRFPAPVVRT